MSARLPRLVQQVGPVAHNAPGSRRRDADQHPSDAQIQSVLAVSGLEKAASIWKQLIKGLGIHLTIEEIIADGDTVRPLY